MTTALAIRDLRKTYKGGHEALKGVSLDVREGDFFALLGPNGAGKTTLIGIVASLVNKSSGTVSIFGHDLDTDTASAKACIGLVPQEFNFNMFEPVVEVVANQAGYYGIERREAFERAEKYLRHLDLWDKRRMLSRNPSGGMKRRLMVARALVHEPKLLILDEPTAGVDIEIRRSMWQYLRQINASGTTIILTTHYLEEAESLCRNIAIINDGRIVEHARMAELLRRLHSEAFVLSLAEPLQGELDADRFRFRQLDDHTIEAELNQGQHLAELFQSLARQGIFVSSMRNKQNRLEQLFMDRLQNGAARPPGSR